MNFTRRSSLPALLLVSVVISSGCVFLSDQVADPDKTVPATCKTKALQLFPDSVELWTTPGFGKWRPPSITEGTTWADGTRMVISAPFWVPGNASAGQDPGLVYCESTINRTKEICNEGPIAYSKEITDENGNTTTRSFRIKAVLNPIAGTEHSGVGDSVFVSFELTQVEFTSCTWEQD